MGTFKIIAAMVLVAVVPATSFAQRLSDVEQGAQIRVLKRSGKTVQGVFLGAVNDSVTVARQYSKVTTTTALTNVRSVEVRDGRAHVNGALRGFLVGFALGAATGALIGAATYEHPDFFAKSRSSNAAFGALIFGTGGLAVGTIAGAAIGTPVWKPLDLRLDRDVMSHVSQ